MVAHFSNQTIQILSTSTLKYLDSQVHPVYSEAESSAMLDVQHTCWFCFLVLISHCAVNLETKICVLFATVLLNL